MLSKPIVLTIAGFDPSGCAGILADIKTFEANGVYGMAVCTANTEQNVKQFNKPNWIAEGEIIDQLRLLQQEVNFEYVKVGLIESFELLNDLADLLLEKNPQTKIVWDPVCKASASFDFHTGANQELLCNIYRKIYLITPNLDEAAILFPGVEAEPGAKFLSQFCNVLLKGGHSQSDFSNDILFTGESAIRLSARRLKNFSKRGTGCVLSAAITANLAKGLELEPACRNAKDYINSYLKSNDTLIGFHNYENEQAAIHYN